MIKATTTQNGEDGIVKLPMWAWTLLMIGVTGLIGTAVSGAITSYNVIKNRQESYAVKLENHEGRITANERAIDRITNLVQRNHDIVLENQKLIEDIHKAVQGTKK